MTATTTIKLDSEDYENIYLRVREKLIFFFLGIFGALGGTGLLVAYLSISGATEKAVQKYVQTPEFKTSVLGLANARMESLEKRASSVVQSISEAEKRVVALTDAPISVTASGFSLLSKEGARFGMEVGEVQSGGVVEFKTPFSMPPLVLLTPTTNQFGHSVLEMRLQKNTPVEAATLVTTNGFTVTNYTGSLRKYSWVAVGR